jgi:hypothetical protein
MASPICTPDDPTGLGELYRQVNAGPGTAAIEPAVASIRTFAPKLSGSADRINTALSGTGVSWQGRSADAAAAELTGVARWASAGGDHAGAGSGQVQAYADSFAELRSKVASPQPVPDLTRWDSVWETFGVTSDHSRAVQHNHQAALAALEALDVHQRNTDRAITGFPDIAGVPGTGPGPGDQPGPGGPGAGAGAGGGHPGSAPGGRPDGSATTSAAGAGPTGGHSATVPPGVGPHESARPGPGASGPVLYPGGPPAGPRPVPGGGPARGPRPNIGAGPPPGAIPPPAGGRFGPAAGRPPRPGYFPGGPAAPGSGPGPRPGGIGPELAPRTGAPAGVQSGAEPHGGPAGNRSPAGAGGYGPMMGGAGAGPAGDRDHRNQHFIPSDEPFVVQFDDVAPPVLGAEPWEGR